MTRLFISVISLALWAWLSPSLPVLWHSLLKLNYFLSPSSPPSFVHLQCSYSEKKKMYKKKKGKERNPRFRPRPGQTTAGWGGAYELMILPDQVSCFVPGFRCVMITSTACTFWFLGGMGHTLYVTSSPSTGTYSPSMLRERETDRLCSKASCYRDSDIQLLIFSGRKRRHP